MVPCQLRDRASFRVTAALDLLLSFFLSFFLPFFANREKYEGRCPRGCFLVQRVLDLSHTQRCHCPIHLASSETDCVIGEGAIGSSPEISLARTSIRR